MGLMDILGGVSSAAHNMAPAMRVLAAKDKRDLYPAIDAMNAQTEQSEAKARLEELATGLAENDITSYEDLQRVLLGSDMPGEALSLAPKVFSERDANQERTGLATRLHGLDPDFQDDGSLGSSVLQGMIKDVEARKNADINEQNRINIRDEKRNYVHSENDRKNDLAIEAINAMPGINADQKVSAIKLVLSGNGKMADSMIKGWTKAPKAPKDPHPNASRLGINYSDEITNIINRTGVAPNVAKDVVDEALSMSGDNTSFATNLQGLVQSLEGVRPQSDPLPDAIGPDPADYYRAQLKAFGGDKAKAQAATRKRFPNM